MKKLLLVDLSHVFWTTWHATAGQEVDAAYRVTLERVARLGDGFDDKVVCCDVGPSWRKKLYPEYKAGRPERDQAAYDQLRRVREQLERDGWPTHAVEGYEADDIIATLTRLAPPDYHVTIASGDKDLLQLVVDAEDGVEVQSTNNGGALMHVAEVQAKFGVLPTQLGDYLALVGDKSDNVPGCPGCGEKNASRLLNELGSLKNMLDAPDGITPPGMREKVIANRKAIELARQLVTLSTDVPLTFEDAIRRPEPKPEDVVGPAPDDGDASPPDARTAHQAAADERAREAGTAANPKPSAAVVVAAPETAMVLDRADPRWTLRLEPQSAKMLQWYCEQLAASQLYRKFGNAAAIMSVILRGRALGLDMTTALDVFHVIKGKPTMSAMAIIGLCLSSGKAEYFDPIESDSDTEATWETKRVGRPPKRLTYTIEMARLAGLLAPSQNGEPSNWVKRPRPMLRKQSGVELARLVYPDVCSNIYAPDEMED